MVEGGSPNSLFEAWCHSRQLAGGNRDRRRRISVEGSFRLRANGRNVTYPRRARKLFSAHRCRRRRAIPIPRSRGAMFKQLTLALLSQVSAWRSKPNDYSDAKSWLCRPGQHDACDIDLSTTVMKPVP